MLLKLSTKGQMEYSFEGVRMASRNRFKIQRVLIAIFVATLAWHATAHADDILDRGVTFHIAAAPLSSALIEFSKQSGLQVAAADADVSHLNSNGVNGTFPTHVALDLLLQGTGLGFSRVGTTTVAINSVRAPVIVASTHTDAAARTAEALSPQPSPDDSANPAEIPDVTVTAPRPPTDQELAGHSVYDFVAHHATSHYVDTGTNRNLARWRGGKQSICVLATGLKPAYNAFVTARLRALATYVGAPVESDRQCKSNVQLLFTDNPQQEMDAVIKWATVYFRNRYTGGMKDLIAFRSDHAIQGWYLTTRGGARVLNTDVSLVGLDVLPVWPRITQNYDGSNSLGSHLGAGSGSGIGIGIVILVVDTTKVVGTSIGAIADYLAMLTLSVAQSPDHCDPLPSILDLMSSSCGIRPMPTAITAGDLVFLKALYYKNTGLDPSLSRDQIDANMERQFKLR